VSLVTAADDVLDTICKKAGVEPARYPRVLTRRR
jgi:hypothetical protein